MAHLRRLQSDHGHIVGLDRRICSHQRQPFDSGLRHQDAIERIPVMRRQVRDRECVHMRNRETLETAQTHTLGDVDRRRLGQRQLSDCILDRDFPATCGGEVPPRRGISEGIEKIVVELSALRLKPEPAVCIEEKLHFVKCPRLERLAPASRHIGRQPLIRDLQRRATILRLAVHRSRRDNESAFVDSKNRTPVLHRHKTCHGLARAGNDDVLPEDHLPQQPERWVFAS